MTPLDITFISDALIHLKRRDREPGSAATLGHHYELGLPLHESTIAQIEAKYGFTTPASYRQFLLSLGDGGAGPNWGLLPFGWWPGTTDLLPWHEVFPRWSPGISFPLSSAWNMPPTFFAQEPDYDLLPQEAHQQAEQNWNDLLEHYFREELLHGAIPISEVGCGIFEWLVVTGPEAGTIWVDSRSDYRGIFPLDRDGCGVSFDTWYMSWLHERLTKHPLPERRPGFIRRLFRGRPDGPCL